MVLSQEANELLTGVGPTTPGGKLLRCYWHPVGLVEELTDNHPKKRVRILGEDLILFRLRDGRYGLVAETCSHTIDDRREVEDSGGQHHGFCMINPLASKQPENGL